MRAAGKSKKNLEMDADGNGYAETAGEKQGKQVIEVGGQEVRFTEDGLVLKN